MWWFFRNFLKKPNVLCLMRVRESPFGCWQNLRSYMGFRKTLFFPPSSSFVEVLITVSLECSLRLERFLLLTAAWQPSRSENFVFHFQLLNTTEHFHWNSRFSVPNVADVLWMWTVVLLLLVTQFQISGSRVLLVSWSQKLEFGWMFKLITMWPKIASQKCDSDEKSQTS